MTKATRRLGAGVIVVLLLPSACINVDRAVGEDVASLTQDVEHRTGMRPPAWQAGFREAGVVPEALRLLEDELTEDRAVKVALLNNRDVRVAYERLGIARAELIQAGLLSNPVLDADATFFLDGGTEVELGLAKSFLDLFYLPLRQRLAEHELAAAKAALTHDLVHLVFAVRRAFVRVRAANQLVELQQTALTAARAAHELMRDLRDAGNVTAPEVTRERIAESRARLDLAAAERAALEAREPLNALLGLWGGATQWAVTGRLPEAVRDGLDLARVESRCVAASLDLIENRAHLDAAAQRAGLALREAWLPDGHVGVTAQRDPGGSWGIGPLGSLELPLFDSGEARVGKAAAMLRKLLHGHVQTAVEVRSAARLLRVRVRLLHDRVRFLAAEHLPAQAALVRETLQNYNAMQIGVFQVLEAKRQQVAAGREYLTALRSAWLARLDMQELLAGSLPEDALTPAWPDMGSAEVSKQEGH